MIIYMICVTLCYCASSRTMGSPMDSPLALDWPYIEQLLFTSATQELADAASEPSTTTTTTNADPQGCQIGYGHLG